MLPAVYGNAPCSVWKPHVVYCIKWWNENTKALCLQESLQLTEHSADSKDGNPKSHIRWGGGEVQRAGPC